MSRTVLCCKLKKEAPGLDSPPFPGPLGETIFNQVSQEAWQSWLSQQTMLINEYRLNLGDPKAREYLKAEMQKYFFEADSSKPPAGYKPLDEK